MALKSELMAIGNQASTANRLGLDPIATVAAAGTTQGTATALAANCWNITSGTGGVILNSAEQLQFGANSSGQTITIYPPVGQSFNGGTVNAGITVLTGKSIFVMPAGSTLMANVSA